MAEIGRFFGGSRLTRILQQVSFPRAIQSRMWLAVLSFLLVVAVFPAMAQHPPSVGIAGDAVEISAEGSASLLEQGRILYEAGRFSEAAALWERAAREFEMRGDSLNQAASLNYLSNAYQELGQWEAAQNAIEESLTLLQAQPNAAILARSLTTQGNLQLAIGQPEAALETWQQAEKIYTEAEDNAGAIGARVNQAQALQTLGLYRRARTTLEQVLGTLQAQPDSLLKATALRSLGVTLQVVGDLSKSKEVLEQSLAIAQQLNSPAETSYTLFSLANTVRALKDDKTASELYQKAAETATSPTGKLEAQLNQISLFIETENWAQARALLSPIQSQLANLSPSREAVYKRVNFAQSLQELARVESGKNSPATLPEIARLLGSAAQQAKSLKDARAQAHALTELGNLYQQAQQLEEARTVTRQALAIAQAISADDIAAKGQAQLGEIFKQQGKIELAIAAYTEAVSTFQSLRSDLVAINADVQFSFRENVEPVYRELVGLLLQRDRGGRGVAVRAPTDSTGEVSQENLKQARQVIEALQLAELDNFFREACLDAKPQQIDQIDPTAAVIYPIILRDRLEVILSLPGQPLSHYTTVLPQTEVEEILSQFLEALNPFFLDSDRLRLSQQVYGWLVKPAEAQLAPRGIKTLVFVLDGSLRNLPMAALHDGQQYLVEKYSVALTPGLQLLSPRSLSQKRFTALTAGLTEARQGFSALPGVQFELTEIASEVPSKKLLDRDFTETNLQQQIARAPFPVVHLATHGQFSSDPEQTFILTWDEKVKVREFEDLLRFREEGSPNPIELLVLSACQTATGDNRAALGLAGMAVRSGARSTLATLWSVKDQSTAALMAQFYRDLIQPGVSKAEALRQAQLSLLKQDKFQHPFYWAPFILVGNWL